MTHEAKAALNKLAYSHSDSRPDDGDLEVNQPDCDCETHSQCCLEGDIPGELYTVDEPGLAALVKDGFAEDRGDHYQVSPGSIFRITKAGKTEHERLVSTKEVSPLRSF